MKNVFVAINNIFASNFVFLKSIYETTGSDGETYNCKNGGDVYYCFVFVVEGKMVFKTTKGLNISLSKNKAILFSSNNVKSYTLHGDNSHYFWVYFSYDGSPLPVNTPYDIKNPDEIIDSLITCCKYLNQENEFALMKSNTIFAKCFLDGVDELLLKDVSCNPTNVDILNSVEFINENLFHLPTIEQIAALYGLSLKKYVTKFEKTIGVSPSKYIKEKKLIAAKGFLDNTDLTLQEIAELLELSSSYYLSKIFKKRFGQSPKEYRSKKGK